MNLIAIDPGASGGIAALIHGQVECWKMPATQGDVLYCIRELRNRVPMSEQLSCYIENIPKAAGRASPSSQAVMFENFGYIKGVVQTIGIRTILVSPQKWQKPFGFGTKGTKMIPVQATKEERDRIRRMNDQLQRDWKAKLKAEAQRRFPMTAITLDKADALLILEFAKMAENYREVEQHTPFALKA